MRSRWCNPARAPEGSDQHGRNGTGGEGCDFGLILKGEPTGFSYGFSLGCERKKKNQGYLQSFCPEPLKNGVVINRGLR